MDITYVLLDWFKEANGSYIKEGFQNVQHIKTIIEPKKAPCDYHIGDHVQAMFGKKKYQAEILALGTAGKTYFNNFLELLKVNVKCEHELTFSKSCHRKSICLQHQ